MFNEVVSLAEIGSLRTLFARGKLEGTSLLHTCRTDAHSAEDIVVFGESLTGVQ
jgi:hypothetical protein